MQLVSGSLLQVFISSDGEELLGLIDFLFIHVSVLVLLVLASIDQLVSLQTHPATHRIANLDIGMLGLTGMSMFITLTLRIRLEVTNSCQIQV